MSDWRGYWLFAPATKDRIPFRGVLRLQTVRCVFAALAVLLWLAFRRLEYHWNWTVIARYCGAQFIAGWWMTLGISGVSLMLSTLIGLCCALAAGSRFLPLAPSAGCMCRWCAVRRCSCRFSCSS